MKYKLLIYTFVSIFILLIGIILYLNYSVTSLERTYQNELGKQKSITIKLKDSVTTITKAYASVNDNLNDRLKEINGKNTVIKKLFGQNSALEDSVQKYKLKINTLIQINQELKIENLSLKATKLNDSTFIGNYTDPYLDAKLRFNYTDDYSFNIDYLNIKNKATIIVGEQKNGIITGYIQNDNKYMSKNQSFSIEVSPKIYNMNHWEKYKLYYGAGAGAGIMVLIFNMIK